MLEQLTNEYIFQAFLIFARMGAVLLFIPGLGESYVSAKIRILLAVMLTIILYPMINRFLPPPTEDVWQTGLYIAYEVTVGLLIGLIMRIIQAILHIAGMKIAFMMGLSSATLFDTNQSSQGSIIGGFLSSLGILLFFITDLHYVFIYGLVNSYELFSVNNGLEFETMYLLISNTLDSSFLIAFKIASPVAIVGLMTYIVAGLMGRLMPTMQVFFVLMPLQIFVGFLFIALSLSSGVLLYINYFEKIMLNIFGG